MAGRQPATADDSSGVVILQATSPKLCDPLPHSLHGAGRCAHGVEQETVDIRMVGFDARSLPHARGSVVARSRPPRGGLDRIALAGGMLRPDQEDARIPMLAAPRCARGPPTCAPAASNTITGPSEEGTLRFDALAQRGRPG